MEEKKRVILAGANVRNDVDFKSSMEELAGLAEACEMEIVGELYQNLDRIISATYFGKGKITELKEYAEKEEADYIIFNDELTPSQIRNLEIDTGVQILDRTALILDIFAVRAKTKEAMLQVEVARLKYMLPRLIGVSSYLGRQGGGSGLRNKGTGETKLELDRRRIEDRISANEKELIDLAFNRKNQRKMREKQEIPVVALVGYTNAGKSTILNAMLEYSNAMEEKRVFEKNMLFATLETSVRKISLEDNKNFLLTDTVGFISKLPHHLVKAFRSTLEEVSEADLLLHVVDYSDPNYKKHIEVTKETLESIGVKDIPVVYVYNKVDLLPIEDMGTDINYSSNENGQKTNVENADAEYTQGDNTHLTDAQKINSNEGKIEEIIKISSKKKEDVNRLADLMKGKLFASEVKAELLIPYDKGGLISYFNENCKVVETKYEGDGIWITIVCSEKIYEKYKQYVKNSGNH